MRRGYKTSEFAFSVVTVLCIVLMNSGALPEGSEVTKGIASLAAALTAAGYGWARATVKKNGGSDATP